MKRATEETVSVPVVTVYADAEAPPKVREAGSALVWLCQDGRFEEATELGMDARNDLADRVDDALGNPENESASILTDIAVRHVVSGLTAEMVLVLIQSHPELVINTRRDVEAIEAKRYGR